MVFQEPEGCDTAPFKCLHLISDAVYKALTSRPALPPPTNSSPSISQNVTIPFHSHPSQPSHMPPASLSDDPTLPPNPPPNPPPPPPQPPQYNHYPYNESSMSISDAGEEQAVPPNNDPPPPPPGAGNAESMDISEGHTIERVKVFKPKLIKKSPDAPSPPHQPLASSTPIKGAPAQAQPPTMPGIVPLKGKPKVEVQSPTPLTPTTPALPPSPEVTPRAQCNTACESPKAAGEDFNSPLHPSDITLDNSMQEDEIKEDTDKARVKKVKTKISRPKKKPYVRPPPLKTKVSPPLPLKSVSESEHFPVLPDDDANIEDLSAPSHPSPSSRGKKRGGSPCHTVLPPTKHSKDPEKITSKCPIKKTQQKVNEPSGPKSISKNSETLSPVQSTQPSRLGKSGLLGKRKNPNLIMKVKTKQPRFSQGEKRKLEEGFRPDKKLKCGGPISYTLWRMQKINKK